MKTRLIVGLLAASFTTSTVANPLIAGLGVAAIVGFTGSIAGFVSMTTDVATIMGDYEETYTELKMVSYVDVVVTQYYGVRDHQVRAHWVDGAGQSCYRREYTFWANGQTHFSVDANPFAHHYEARQYYCKPTESISAQIASLTTFGIGYEVKKAANLGSNRAPNPIPVTVSWIGRVLPTTCSHVTWDNTWTSSERSTRYALSPVPIPSWNMEVESFDLRF